jgi:hypothetical protein
VVDLFNEPVAVEVQLGATVRPMAFVWRGRRFEVQSWGRESSETQGGRTMQCHLVQTAGPETWELCQDIETAQWTLVRHWARGTRTV